MAAYRRFVAYLYEYRKDKKGVNCGFVRIEAWRNVCRIELHLLCPGLVSGSECSVYGFVRKDESIDGILLGVCETAKEEINCILESSVEHMGDSEHSLEEMGGMIITTDQGGFFGTEWDDMPIRPEKFRVVPRIQEDTSESAAADGKAETDEMVKSGKDEENSRTESKEDKEHFIEDTFGRVISKEMTGLLVLMIAKDRHKDIVETLNMFMAKVLEYKKIGTAYVKTAVPLSEEQKEKVLKRLLATTDYKEFRMNYSVEPELLGGMIIRIDDRVVDSSIKTKLDKLAGDLKKIQLS